jgi:hypothetical protein
MRKTRSALLWLALAACSAPEEPTPMPVPGDAFDINHYILSGIHAYQTDFVVKAAYPSTPVLELYAMHFRAPWVRCDWSGPWQHFIDATAAPPRAVHQQLHMWVNRDAGRTLMLATRYYSRKGAALPDSDEQQVVVVEQTGQDIDEAVSRLKLRCPAVPL